MPILTDFDFEHFNCLGAQILLKIIRLKFQIAAILSDHLASFAVCHNCFDLEHALGPCAPSSIFSAFEFFSAALLVRLAPELQKLCRQASMAYSLSSCILRHLYAFTTWFSPDSLDWDLSIEIQNDWFVNCQEAAPGLKLSSTPILRYPDSHLQQHHELNSVAAHRMCDTAYQRWAHPVLALILLRSIGCRLSVAPACSPRLPWLVDPLYPDLWDSERLCYYHRWRFGGLQNHCCRVSPTTFCRSGLEWPLLLEYGKLLVGNHAAAILVAVKNWWRAKDASGGDGLVQMTRRSQILLRSFPRAEILLELESAGQYSQFWYRRCENFEWSWYWASAANRYGAAIAGFWAWFSRT